ncbi:reverse transcriptase domain-containing protein [Rhizobium laguerreae]|uniref:reverse transcriptase domain-containing protein n=1 Tax=Rhizobium laguerreae TaxID=1076926 RepID=UPI001C91C0B8|nr:reverse transcriptase domain-containing protein [Rhizobium laguerreae]MBY3137313.1 hypothetical protein [Rhizobium laguerreae]
MSKRLRKQGEKSLDRLQARIAKAEARGDFRGAKRLRRLLSRSYNVKVGMMVEEMDRQNGLKRKPFTHSETSPSQANCNALQRRPELLTEWSWHDERMAVNEVLIEDDIVKIDAWRRTRPWRPWKNADAKRKANWLHLGKAPADIYKVFPVAKSSGGYRAIHAFGLMDRVRQRLLLATFDQSLKTSPSIYSAKGNGGRKAAVERIRTLLEDGRKVLWAAPLDIKGFFNSVNRDWVVANMPMPKAYIKSTILLDDGEEYVGRYMRDCFGMARTRAKLTEVGQLADMMLRELWITSRAGLPQGAATSSAIATHIVADVLAVLELPKGVFLNVYADDMLILGASKEAVERAIVTLCATFASHPAGSFVLHRVAPRRISDGFEFLGMSFRRRKGRCECKPDRDAFRRAKARLVECALQIEAGELEASALHRVLAGVRECLWTWSFAGAWVWQITRQLAAVLPNFRHLSASQLLRLRDEVQSVIFEQGRR